MYSSMNMYELVNGYIYILMDYTYAHLLYLKYGLITLLTMFVYNIILLIISVNCFIIRLYNQIMEIDWIFA